MVIIYNACTVNAVIATFNSPESRKLTQVLMCMKTDGLMDYPIPPSV